MSPEIERTVAKLVKHGYKIKEAGRCLLVAYPGQHLRSGIYVSLSGLEDSGDPYVYMRLCLAEAARS